MLKGNTQIRLDDMDVIIPKWAPFWIKDPTLFQCQQDTGGAQLKR